MLSVVMLDVVKLCVIMVSAVAQISHSKIQFTDRIKSPSYIKRENEP
jgi:hypothetical protein